MQRDAVEAGFDLKDASAWNVLFDGTRPVFCDLLSFTPLRMRRWWAFGQFARHFLLPLLVARRRGVHGHQAFRVWRDGMPPDVARSLIGPGRFLTRYWPLMAGKFDQPEARSAALEASRERQDAAAIARFRAGLHGGAEWMPAGCRPRPRASGASTWSGYASERQHYDDASVARKRALIGEWLARLQPGWVADFGCNSGEFSRIALEHDAQVVAIDGDHDALEQAFVAGDGCTGLHPVVATIDDLLGGRGWAGAEFAGLAQRLEQRFDVVMMLALIHHLAIAAAVPFDAVATFAARCTRRWLIVELIDESDSQLSLLCEQHQRQSSEFTRPRQREAFQRAGFRLELEIELPVGTRSLALLSLSHG